MSVIAETVIADIIAREILDSRGFPTVEAEVRLGCGVSGRAAVPSGASTGAHEATERRDGDESRYGGKGVLKAVAAVHNEIAPVLRGLSPFGQRQIDRRMLALDGTAGKSRLGANAILAVSLATARAAATALGQPLYRYIGGAGVRTLPVPLMNILNGGLHADNRLDFQEFMIVPGLPDSFARNLQAGVEVFRALRTDLARTGHSVNVGDEGGLAPDLAGTRAALDLVTRAIGHAGYRPGEDIAIALDCAASGLYREGRYHLPGEGKSLDSGEMVRFLGELVTEWPVVSIEDGLAEDDWEGWKILTQELGHRVQLVGDDLFVTSTGRIAQGVSRGVANAVLVKPNQTGTLSETLDAVAYALGHGYRAILSHRSGETEDTSIADLAVGTGCGQIKTGAPSRSDRTAKYNRLLRIGEELGDEAVFPAGGIPRPGRAAAPPP